MVLGKLTAIALFTSFVVASQEDVQPHKSFGRFVPYISTEGVTDFGNEKNLFHKLSAKNEG